MKPSIKKGIIITSICAFTLVGIKFYLNSTNKIDVNSVSTLICIHIKYRVLG